MAETRNYIVCEAVNHKGAIVRPAKKGQTPRVIKLSEEAAGVLIKSGALQRTSAEANVEPGKTGQPMKVPVAERAKK